MKYTSSWSLTNYSAQDRKWTQSDLRFCKNGGAKGLQLMKKGVNWNENQVKHYAKCLQSVK